MATLPLKFERIAVERTLPLRHEVLWPDMPIDKVKLPEDQNGWHFGAFMDNPLANDDPIAVISLFLDPIPIDHIITVRFRKFACKTTMQGQGVGTALFKHAMHFAHSELKAEVFWCDARVSSVAWYSGRGLSQFGHKFYKGAVEYVRMRVRLSETSPR
ncbi:GCN5-related N-acetyltransferase [Lentinula novae-zelandiae]|nr:GCN5-related N-acetyltransferase [Lentinula novae-zelandiae]